MLRTLFSLGEISTGAVAAIVISSVVPPASPALEEMALRYFGIQPLFIDPTMDLGMPVRYHPPEDVGADRIVNAVAAFEQFGGPAIVVDFGTATTFDAISDQGEYLGGVIAPGIAISAEALFLGQRACRGSRYGRRTRSSAIRLWPVFNRVSIGAMPGWWMEFCGA